MILKTRTCPVNENVHAIALQLLAGGRVGYALSRLQSIEMSDTLYLSLWYPNLRLAALPDKLTAVLGAFAAHGGEAQRLCRHGVAGELERDAGVSTASTGGMGAGAGARARA